MKSHSHWGLKEVELYNCHIQDHLSCTLDGIWLFGFLSFRQMPHESVWLTKFIHVKALTNENQNYNWVISIFNTFLTSSLGLVHQNSTIFEQITVTNYLHKVFVFGAHAGIYFQINGKSTLCGRIKIDNLEVMLHFWRQCGELLEYEWVSCFLFFNKYSRRHDGLEIMSKCWFWHLRWVG